ncbi:IPT/TIG domain-containing protein [Spirosoma montaniterrae]|uniref:Cell shape-determining protein MreB n=1 Tax=Spirosoma montaniterrae TaxID=1178516 RepID=A0A1P9X1R2_9BACT|nr:IPT/TIG domain-containing protein [Spirosoma montaniterrae]AQG81528.1 cell shape-determining protein MreB [Spirosoma montaniterrae]
MQRFKQWQYALLLLLGLTVVFAACNNDDQPAPVLSITGINPTSAPINSTVTITGTEFNATPASNTVTFGGNAIATVVSASPTQLVVVVPANAQNGTISVTTGGQTATSTQQFQLSARPTVTVAGNITANTTWTAGNIYVLQGFVNVDNGATLTIEPGTIVKGGGRETDPSGNQRGATLLIRPGAKINAAGTATNPIIFTSGRPAGQRARGDWGGIFLIGKAPINQPGGTLLEGGVGGTTGTFNEPADNSGVLQYVRIEFSGIALLANSESNGLTMYGVGSGTTIDHVQVSYGGDDAFEWFGGTVNMKYLIAFRGFDDDWDVDFGYTGKVQYGVALRDPNVADVSGSNGFESDNFNPGAPATGPNAGLPLTSAVFANMSNFAFSGAPSSAPTPGGSGPYQSGMHLRRNTAISIFNSVLCGYPEGLRLDAQPNTTNTLENATSGALQLRGIVVANTNTPVRGAQSITNDQATGFFNTAAFSNRIIATADIATLLLNPQNFNLAAPNFLPQAGSPLLTGAIWDGKGTDAFFTKEPFRGAFGTTDWTRGWANWDPQNAPYN